MLKWHLEKGKDEYDIKKKELKETQERLSKLSKFINK